MKVNNVSNTDTPQVDVSGGEYEKEYTDQEWADYSLVNNVCWNENPGWINHLGEYCQDDEGWCWDDYSYVNNVEWSTDDWQSYEWYSDDWVNVTELTTNTAPDPEDTDLDKVKKLIEYDHSINALAYYDYYFFDAQLWVWTEDSYGKRWEYLCDDDSWMETWMKADVTQRKTENRWSKTGLSKTASINSTTLTIPGKHPDEKKTVKLAAPLNHNLLKESDHEDWLMNDSGAAVSVCPPDYATEFPLIPADSSSQCIKSASGQPLNIWQTNCDLLPRQNY
jgi:hypothetical protein